MNEEERENMIDEVTSDVLDPTSPRVRRIRATERSAMRLSVSLRQPSR